MSSAPTQQNQKSISKALIPFTGPAILAIGTIIYYFPIISGQGYLWNDFIEQYFPYRLFAALSLKEGTFPFWNPYVFSGMPFFADIQAAVLYPFNLILTPFASASREWLNPLLLGQQVVLHIFIAGLGMFLLCRDYSLERGAAMIGALTFMFCGFLTTHIFHINLIHTASWFPLVFLLFRRMVQSMQLRYCALCALLLTIDFFAGHPQIILFTSYWLGAYYVFILLKQVRSGSSLKREIRRCGLVVVLITLSVGMASIQLLPSQELASHSARPTMPYEESREGSLRPYRFITFLAPDFFGKPGSTYWGIAADEENPGVHYYWETAAYVGVLPLILATLAVVFVRKPIILFLGITASTACFLALGDSFFLYKIFHAFLPGFNLFRIPGRLAFILAISIAMLAAFGFHWLIEYGRSADRRVLLKVERTLLTVTGLLVFFYLFLSAGLFQQLIVDFIAESAFLGPKREALQLAVAEKIYPLCIQSSMKGVFLFSVSTVIIASHMRGLLKPMATRLFCITLLFGDLLLFGYGYASSPVPVERVYEKKPLVTELQKEGANEFFRINSRDSRPGTEDLGGSNMMFQKNQGSVHRLYLMEGFNPLRLKRQLIDRKKRTLDLLNVKYTLRVDGQDGSMHFAVNDDYLPRVWMAYDFLVEQDEDKIREILHTRTFDYRHSIILEEQPSLSPSVQKDSINWKAEITEYDLNTILLDVETDKEGFLVLSEIYYPAWKAYVDGQPVKLYRSDYALRAIPIPEGKHTVACNYESQTFRIGAALTIVAFLITIGLLLLTYRPSVAPSIPVGSREATTSHDFDRV